MNGGLQKALVNGIPVAHVSLDDRGLAYGDGLFATLAVIGGVLCLWRRHVSRLRQGCERLLLPMRDVEILAREAEQIVENTERCILKIMVTRGVGGRGYRAPLEIIPTWILRAFPWPDVDTQTEHSGLRVRLCETPVSTNPALAGLKHLGRLDNVMARSEWSDSTIAEGLMQDVDGNIVEGTQSNLFLERQGELVTPALDYAGVAGVVRGLIMDLAVDYGTPVREQRVSLDDIHNAGALYLTNSIMGIRRVRSLDSHLFDETRPIHPVMTRALSQVFHA